MGEGLGARGAPRHTAGRRGALINGKPVNSAEDLRSAAEKVKGTAALLVKRGEASIFVPIEIE